MDTYSIRELSEISGVNAVTLRAWERRYGLLKPRRTPKGHRYYSNDDVEQIRSVLRWLDRGVAISKVKQLLGADTAEAGMEPQTDAHWQDLIQEVLESASAFRCEKLSQQMNELFASYPLETLARNFFPPLFESLERKVTQQFGAMAEKKFIETELVLRLHAQLHHQNPNNQGERVLLIVLGKDERHYQSLLFALALLEAGYRLHLLLDGCELREIPLIVEKSAVQAVICYSDSKPKELQLEAEIERAARHARVPFFLAGHWLDVVPSLKKIEAVQALDHSLRDAACYLQQHIPHDKAIRSEQP